MKRHCGKDSIKGYYSICQPGDLYFFNPSTIRIKDTLLNKLVKTEMVDITVLLIERETKRTVYSKTIKQKSDKGETVFIILKV